MSDAGLQANKPFSNAAPSNWNMGEVGLLGFMSEGCQSQGDQHSAGGEWVVQRALDSIQSLFFSIIFIHATKYLGYVYVTKQKLVYVYTPKLFG